MPVPAPSVIITSRLSLSPRVCSWTYYLDQTKAEALRVCAVLVPVLSEVSQSDVLLELDITHFMLHRHKPGRCSKSPQLPCSSATSIRSELDLETLPLHFISFLQEVKETALTTMAVLLARFGALVSSRGALDGVLAVILTRLQNEVRSARHLSFLLDMCT